MGKVLTSTDSNFTRDTTSGLVLVDFWAEWCGPCQMMIPRLDELAEKMTGKLTVMKHNVDTEPQVPSQLRIMSIPTMILFKDGQPVNKFVGAMPVDELIIKISAHL